MFSKYAWVVPLKNKTGLSLVEAFKTILASGRKPENIITDQARIFQQFQSMRYIDTLPDLVYSYNHTIHRSIKRKLADVTADNEKQVWHTLYDDHDEVKHPKYKLKIGDQVRISKIKRTFEKGYLPNFSKGIFTVSKQIPRDLPVYKLKD